jgi:hypothetical protein
METNAGSEAAGGGLRRGALGGLNQWVFNGAPELGRLADTPLI